MLPQRLDLVLVAPIGVLARRAISALHRLDLGLHFGDLALEVAILGLQILDLVWKAGSGTGTRDATNYYCFSNP